MKTCINYFLLLPFLLFSGNSFSQEKKKTETITIMTSGQCEQCKERMEKALAFTKGVKKSDFDVNTKIITVVYKPAKTSPEKIREAISKVGYDADSVVADAKAYELLPPCCKKDGHK